MAKTVNINENYIRNYIRKNRPPAEIRDQLDIGYSYKGETIEIYERRPIYSKKGAFQNLSYAKIKYVKTLKTWKLYWMRASGKWQSYEPFSQSTHLEEILEIIDKDEYGCFKG